MIACMASIISLGIFFSVDILKIDVNMSFIALDIVTWRLSRQTMTPLVYHDIIYIYILKQYKPRNRSSYDKTFSLHLFDRFLSSARVSLEVCVYTITGSELTEILIDLHNKGVIVKVITDGEQQNASGSRIHQFRENGWLTKCEGSGYI